MLSRREWLARLAMLIGLAVLAAAAAGRVSKAVAKYQDYPKDGQMCGMCKDLAATRGRA
ncbi:MAG: hypothetical protein ACM3JG_04050 [Thiohalocapsa sp.]